MVGGRLVGGFGGLCINKTHEKNMFGVVISPTHSGQGLFWCCNFIFFYIYYIYIYISLISLTKPL